MAKRLFDVVSAVVGLLAAAPLIALAAIGIRLTDAGPAFYRCRRIGAGGRPFTMYKLRTMRMRSDAGRRITAHADRRVFPLGALLRRTKVDELPQLLNVLRGEMSIVGPRPEEPSLVAGYYSSIERETLRVRPGLVSPGSLYHTTHGDALLSGGDPERLYIVRLLPIKLALDLVYVRHASLRYDLALIGRTVTTLAAQLAGAHGFREPPEMPAARLIIAGRAA